MIDKTTLRESLDKILKKNYINTNESGFLTNQHWQRVATVKIPTIALDSIVGIGFY